MRERVYIETTVVSYLTANRATVVTQMARQAATKQWWRVCRPACDLFVSEVVALEAQEGDADAVRRRMEIVKTIPHLPTTEEAGVLSKTLVRAHALPSSAEDDALHIAIASVQGMDILLTWNCRHIANVVEMPRIRATIEQAGYDAPTIATPADLLEAMGETL